MTGIRPPGTVPPEVSPRADAVPTATGIHQPWFSVRRELPPRRQAALSAMAFLLPLALWCALSYVPWIWHPLMLVDNPGDSGFLTAGMRVNRATFADENAKLVAAGKAPATGAPANPLFVPAPDAVARAFYTAFTTPPLRRDEPWLYEALLHSIRAIIIGFSISVAIAVPLGILCGSFRAISHLVEPVVDFIRYMPYPAFAPLVVAVFGIDDPPKIAIIVIATVFCTTLVVANTARQVDRSLLEAAQTLGADQRRLLTHVVVPAMLPNLYNDLRIALGSAWTSLIVAELIGASSGISYFINQQGKYRNYDKVFVGIICIGLIGLATDQILSFAGRFLFPWQGQPQSRAARAVWMAVTLPLRLPWLAVRLLFARAPAAGRGPA
jgi:NitT/TauT family transport system permease protein